MPGVQYPVYVVAMERSIRLTPTHLLEGGLLEERNPRQVLARRRFEQTLVTLSPTPESTIRSREIQRLPHRDQRRYTYLSRAGASKR